MKNIAINMALLAAIITAGMQVACAEIGKAGTDADAQRLMDVSRIVGLSSYPDDHLLLSIMIRSGNLRNGIEVGAANGYGACHMGLAFEKTGGKLTTIEIDPDMARQARENIARAGLEQTVTLVEGDALKALPQLDGEYDFVFIDAQKSDYLKYFNAIKDKLAPGALVVAHNAIVYASSMRDYIEAMSSDPEYVTVIVRPGTTEKDGIMISYKKP